MKEFGKLLVFVFVAMLSLLILVSCGSDSSTTDNSASTGGNTNNTSDTSGSDSTGDNTTPAATEDIAIVKYVEHTSLNEIETAIKTKVEAEGLTTKCYNGNAKMDDITQTLTTLKNKNVKVVVCIATPVAAAAQSVFAGTDTKVVFAAVSDPVSANIVTNLAAPEGICTGTSDAVDLEKQVDLALSVNPSLSKLGYIYTESEANSVANAARLETICSAKGITLVKKQISNAAEITEVFNSIKSKIDALIVTDDNNVASAMTTLAPLCISAKIPCYCAADSEIKDGGMMGYSINYTTLGTDTGAMAVEIFNGKAVNQVPVKVYTSAELKLFYNSTFVKNAGITIPADLLAKAEDLASK